MDFDQDRITYANTNLLDQNEGNNREGFQVTEAQNHFREFLLNFRVGPNFIYRDQLLANFRKRNYILDINLNDLSNYDSKLYILIKQQPNQNLSLLELAAKLALQKLAAIEKAVDEEWPDIQVTITSDELALNLRDLTAEHVNQLVRIPGIIISAGRPRAKAVAVRLQCQTCGKRLALASASPFAGPQVPNRCDGQGDGRALGDEGGGAAPQNCGPAPYRILPDECTYLDQQTLKLQESPEEVPTGEMPRNLLCSVDRRLVDRVPPGTRVALVGVASLFQSAAAGRVGGVAVRVPYLRAVGVSVEAEGAGRAGQRFSPAEEEACLRLARQPGVYERLARSIAPAVSGEYTRDIKKALACQLLGGSRKTLPDGMRLRGDINVLLLGDPSTAKSQFLKFIEKVAPVGVYTSGKGSSAAGLTASVVRDRNNEFYLEGGAMVLADGGTVCIDEFDKMREADRVAIHEAMEQQTISVAKAGITTVLNSRTSVLAAANPIYGRYDDLKSASENIDLMTTILSRFDLIFIVRDIRDEERDKSIARHVMSVHMTGGSEEPSQSQGGMDPDGDGPLDLGMMKRYVAYCRQRCAPRLGDRAAEMLASQYVRIRDDLRRQAAQGGGEQAVPITVRQLEALVRLAEALAKMRLAAEVSMGDVEEALRLFRVSTMSAARSGSDLLDTQKMNPAVREEIKKAEDFIKHRMPLGTTANVRKLCEEALAQGHGDYAVRRALAVLARRQELVERDQGRLVTRRR